MTFLSSVPTAKAQNSCSEFFYKKQQIISSKSKRIGIFKKGLDFIQNQVAFFEAKRSLKKNVTDFLQIAEASLLTDESNFNIYPWKSLTKDQIFKLAILSLENINGHLFLAIQARNFFDLLEEHHQYEYLRAAIRKGFGIYITLSLENFPKLSKEQRYQLIKEISGSTLGSEPAVKALTSNQKIFSKQEKLSLARIIVRNLYSTPEWYKSLDIRLSSLSHILDPTSFQTLKSYVYLLDPAYIYKDQPYDSSYSEARAQQQLKNLRSIVDLKLHLAEKNFFQQYPEILNLAWDRVERRDVGLKLIGEGIRLWVKGKIIPKNSIDLISEASGLDLSQLNILQISQNTLAIIYELTLSIQENLLTPFFYKIRISQDLYKSPEKLIELLTLIRDLKAIKGNERTAANALIEILAKEVISSENFNSLLSSFKTTLQNEINNLFLSKNSGHDSIVFKEFPNLQTQWGDLGPIITLIARYKGNPSWEPILPLLKKVFIASLKGEFKKFKFKGDPQNLSDQKAAQDQLSFLSPEQIELWAKGRTLAKIFDPFLQKESPSTQQEDLAHLIHGNLIRNSGAEKMLTKRIHLEFLQFILQQKSGVKEMYQKMHVTFHSVFSNWNIHTLHQDIFYSILYELKNSQFKSHELPKIMRFLEYLLDKHPEILESENQRIQIAQDLISIRTLASNVVQKVNSQEFLIFTVLNSDPRFLLTIGDRVQTSSCQNYRTGLYIESLLGYVVDANVQALTSFALERGHFHSKSDFKKVYEAYQNKEALESSFDGNLMLAYFTLPSGEVIQTLPLDYAYLRQIIKIGKNTKTEGPGLFAERGYLQNHMGLAQMREQHTELLNELAIELQASIQQKTQMIRTRNTLGGQYSDAANGIRKWNYILDSKKTP